MLGSDVYCEVEGQRGGRDSSKARVRHGIVVIGCGQQGGYKI
jgi:hypothetical protein